MSHYHSARTRGLNPNPIRNTKPTSHQLTRKCKKRGQLTKRKVVFLQGSVHFLHVSWWEGTSNQPCQNIVKESCPRSPAPPKPASGTGREAHAAAWTASLGLRFSTELASPQKLSGPRNIGVLLGEIDGPWWMIKPPGKPGEPIYSSSQTTKKDTYAPKRKTR